MPDKNQAIINFLRTCPVIQTNPMFFNFGNIEDGAHQIITRSDDVSLQKSYIDGSISKRFTFYLDNFTSVSYNPIVAPATDENLEEFNQMQLIIDWINEQGLSQNYPDFGNKVVIDEMKSLTSKPEMIGVDNTLNSPVAVYRISIQIDYLDNSTRLWN